MSGVLDEAYHRFRPTGPEWGEDQLTNHGPMAVEVLVRRGHAESVDRWVDRYIRRLDDLPAPGDRITDQNWRDALGDVRRVSDWAAYFADQLADRPWRDVLALWWPRLLPGIVAGTTHGVIRVGHVVRALLGGAETPETAGQLDAGAAIDALPRIPEQAGNVATRFGQLDRLPGWPASVGDLRPAAEPDEVPARLADLVSAATVRYLRHGHASPVLLVHTATAPNAVLHILPVLPRELWAPSLSAIWSTTAAIVSGYAPAGPAPTPVRSLPTGPGAVAEVVDRAVAHGDEHVIKFTDTAAEVYARTGHTDAVAAALHIGELIPRP